MRDCCKKCRKTSLGCEKFCSSYRSSYQDTIRDTLRIRKREHEIYLKMKGVKNNDRK